MGTVYNSTEAFDHVHIYTLQFLNYTFYVRLCLKEMQAGTFITWQHHKDQAKRSAVYTAFPLKSLVKMLRVAAAAL